MDDDIFSLRAAHWIKQEEELRKTEEEHTLVPSQNTFLEEKRFGMHTPIVRAPRRTLGAFPAAAFAHLYSHLLLHGDGDSIL